MIDQDRPPTKPQIASSDGVWLAVGILVPILGWLMETRGDELVYFRPVPSVTMPHTCYSRMLFHLDCPFCGLTRSTIHLMHGRWAESIQRHRLGWFALLLIVAQIPWRLWRIYFQPRTATAEDSSGTKSLMRMPTELAIILGLLALFWLNRLSEGLGF